MTDFAHTASRITRRGFLGGAAGLGFAVSFGANGLELTSEARAAGRRIGAWVRISPDDAITIVTPAAEMGQGSMTGVPVALAEEMDADWSKVSLEMAPADPETYGYVSWGGRKSMGIYASLAVRSYYRPMRMAGAQVRRVLMANAAQIWGVRLDALTTEPGVVIHPPSGRRLTYGKIAAVAEVPARMPTVKASELKKNSDFRLIGRSVPRRDIPGKVDGSARYSIDVQLPGMVYASTVHSPVQLAKPSGWNDAEIRAMKGVIDVVGLEVGVAVVADTFEHVLAARDELRITWVPGALAEGFDSEQALDSDYAAIAEDAGASSRTVGGKGDVEAAFNGAAKV